LFFVKISPTKRGKIIKRSLGEPHPIRNAAIVLAVFLMIEGQGNNLLVYLLGVVIISLALCFVA
jgi:hypothetical protein